MDLSKFGIIGFDPAQMETPDLTPIDDRNKKRLYKFTQFEASPRHLGRALALKNYWIYKEVEK